MARSFVCLGSAIFLALAFLIVSHSKPRPSISCEMVVFTDKNCSRCHFFKVHVYPKLKENYIDKGLLRYEEIDSSSPVASLLGEDPSYPAVFLNGKRVKNYFYGHLKESLKCEPLGS